MERTACIASALVLGMLGCAGGTESSDLSDGGAPAETGVLVPADAGGADGGSVDSGKPDAPSASDAAAEGASGQDASDGAADAAPPTTLDLHQATLYDNPPGLADWPVTTQITDVEFQYQGADGVHVEFSKRDGTGSWPDVTPPGWTGPLEYTLGFAEYINGQWYASAAIEFWRGLPAAGGNVAEDIDTKAQCTAFGAASSCQVAKNWYYDGRWGALAGYQPATGEIIGVFVVAGNLRGVTDGSQSPVQERSNVVLVPMPGFAGAKYTF
ncbi:MAG TPA: hypothetical protein VIF09_16795 [Polyangiaceae bacterium]|jgi:hypothetical protein